MSYSDLMIMPTYERKFFINKLSTEFEERNDEIEKQRNKSRS